MPCALVTLEVASGKDGPTSAGNADGLRWGVFAGAVVVEPGKHLASGDGEGSGEGADADPGEGSAVVRGVTLKRCSR